MGGKHRAGCFDVVLYVFLAATCIITLLLSTGCDPDNSSPSPSVPSHSPHATDNSQPNVNALCDAWYTRAIETLVSAKPGIMDLANAPGIPSDLKHQVDAFYDKPNSDGYAGVIGACRRHGWSP